MKTKEEPRTDTKKQILKLAEQLFQTKGYNGFSYSDISSVLGIKNAAVHYHFPTKADLGVALIRRYRDLLKTTSMEFMKTGENPATQLEGYFIFCLNRQEKRERICPIAITANDYQTLPEPMKKEGENLARETVAWLTRVLHEGRSQGFFTFAGEASDKATLVQAALQGAGQLCRLQKVDALGASIRQIKTDLGL